MSMKTVYKWLALDKVSNAFRIYQENGKIWGLIVNMHRLADYKFGDLVGVDNYGNKYYENKYYPYLKDRWVVHNDKCNFDVDASMVPAEWHNWLHHTTDKPPTVEPRVNYKWLADHTQNFTGSTLAYTPYSTTRQKIESWTPSRGRVRIGPTK